MGSSYAKNAPSLLGVTAQNTGGGLTIYDNALPGMALSCNYCTGEQAMKDFIASSSQGWNAAEPRFLIIQAQPWQDVKPTSFLNVANSLSADYLVVRPDHLFQLIREAKGLALNPLNKYSITASATGNGSISPSGTLMLTQNQTQIFTFSPDSGYFVQAVSVDGVSTTDTSSFTFVNVTANHTLSVAFADSNAVDTDAGSNDAGTIAGAASMGGAGSGGDTPSAGAANAGTGGTRDGGPAANAPPAHDPSGCTCRAAPRAAATPSAWSALGLLVCAGRRRGRRAAGHALSRPASYRGGASFT